MLTHAHLSHAFSALNPAKFLAFSLLLSIFLISPASAISIHHFKGTSEISTTPIRVVVLGNASLDVLDRLGITPVGAPHSLLPSYLEKYRDTTANTGSVAEPDYEAIYMMKPDIIIAENRMLTLFDKLNRIAPTIMFYVQGDQYWQDTQKNWRMLGKLFAKELEVNRIIETTQKQINQVNQSLQKQPLNALMLMNNGSNLAMFNRGSRFSIIFDEFGFNEAKSHKIPPVKGRHGNLVSFEYLADARPDAIFVLDREQAIGLSSGKAQKTFNNPLVNSTPAAQQEKIVFVDANAWYIAGGGITATQTMIKDIKKVLN